jgi:hypothetical protein
MGEMRRRLAVAALIPAFALTCLGQAMVEHAAAAAVGAAGGVGGKPVSEGLDKIFGKTAELMKSVEKEKPKTAAVPVKTHTAAQQAVPSDMPAPSGGGGAGTAQKAAGRQRHVEPAAPVAEEAVAAISPLPPPKPRIVPTREELAKVTAGTSSQDLVARLGVPSSKISMQEDGHLLEIFRYSVPGSDLGSVRVVDGAVTEVRQVKE